MEWNWILEEYDDMVYVSDLNNYELLYVNRAGLDMFHLSREELFSGKKHLCYEIFHGRNTPCPFCTNNYLKDSGFYEWEHYNEQLGKTYLLKDRKVLWDGRESRIEFVFDVSKYKNKLDKQGKQQAAMLRSLPGGIARLDARDERTILWYGSEFLSIIGYTEEQFKEELQSQCLYVHPEDLEQAEAAMHEAKETGRSSIMQGRIVTRSGKIRHLTITFSYMDGKDSEDGIPSYYSLGIDVTETVERQRLQQQALEDACRVAKHANQGKTEFLSRMSHDIRTPMNAIVGMTAIAGAHIEDTQKVRDCLKKINTSSKHLLNLINEVLDMSKIESGRLDVRANDFSLSNLVQNVFDVCRPMIIEKGHHLTMNISKVRHEGLYGDESRLQQVLVNILSNAVKYTPAGGRLHFSIEEKPTHAEGASVFYFTFEDDGIGMSEEFVGRIFEPFSRAEDSRISKIQGTGLGMAISQNIIHMMNGEITVDSTLGKGSRFTVSVALKFRDAEDGEPPVLTDLPVLVVDDERDVCEYASLLLKEVGMRAFWVLSGQEAVAEIVRAHEERDDDFAVILDGKMPDMDGLDTAREIRRRVGPDLPIIMLSGYDCSDVGADFLAAGVDVFIMKPLFKSNMVHLLRNFAEDRGCGHASAVPRPEGQRLDGLHVLLVEDNEINQEIAKELLLMEGASVDVADNGEQALNIFARSEEGYYQLVLMDIQMPVMDGYTATAALRSLRRDDAKTAIILAMTANVFSDDVIKAEASGMNGHISKPFDPDKLYAMIAASCHKKRG